MTDPHSQALQGEGQCVATLSPHNVAILFNVYLCNHILLQSGGGTLGTALYTVRGVGSGSRDVDA